MVAMGVLSQTMGTWDRPMSYLSKRLDTGWPGCWWAVVAVGCHTGLGGSQADFGPRFDHKSPTWSQHSPARGPHQWLSTVILDYSIPGTVMWEPSCYYWASSGPESGHSPSWGRRWGLTWLQGNTRRSLCQQTWLEKLANPGPRFGPVHQWHQPGNKDNDCQDLQESWKKPSVRLTLCRHTGLLNGSNYML